MATIIRKPPKNWLLIIICIGLLFLSCGKSKQECLIGEWSVVDMALDGHLSDVFASFSHPDFHHTLILNNDRFFTFCFGENEDFKVFIGSWNFSERDSLLHLKILNDSIDSFQMKVKKLSNKNMEYVFDQYGKGTSLKDGTGLFRFYCKKTDDKMVNSEFDFTKLKMNQWRIPAKKKESKEQIKQRVLDGLTFGIIYLKYYDSIHKSVKLDMLSPLPFHFAGNGLSFGRDTGWENLFYDDEDINIAYNFLNVAFNKPRDKSPENLKNHPILTNMYILETLQKQVNNQ